MQIIQYYPHFGAKRPVDMAWQQVLAEIKSTDNIVYRNTLASRQARVEGKEKEAAKLKSQCGMITPCGRCDGERHGNNLIALTLVGMADIDHIPADEMAAAMQRIKDDPHTLLTHVTNSQAGIRVFYRYEVVSDQGEVLPESAFAYEADKESHDEFLQRIAPVYRAAWEVGTRYFARVAGYPTDKSCKDAVRVSFLCHDPEAMLREDATPIIVTAADIKAYADNPHKPSPTDKAHAAPVMKDQLFKAKVLEEFKFQVDEQLIQKLLESHHYEPSGRHLFWVKLGFRLKHFGHSVYEIDAYKTAALRMLDARGLVLGDDPSCRLPREIEEAMLYGFRNGREGEEEWLRGYQDSRVLPPTQPAANSTPQASAPASEDDFTDEDLIKNQCPLFPDSVYLNLPDELWLGLAPVVNAIRQNGVPRRRQDLLLMGLLTNYSALCAETHVPYGTHDYSANIAFIGLSVAGNGKSEMSYGFKVVEKVDSHLEQESAREHKAWQEDADAYQLAMQDKKMSREEKEALEKPGPEPQERLLVMPGTTSRSQFTLCMNAMGRDGLIINSTEIQTIASTLKLDVGDFSDLLCKAMSNERIDQFFKVDDRRIKIEKPKLSVCLSGTFEQFHNFIPDYENGLFSRFTYMMMEPHITWIPQQPNPEHGDYERELNDLADDAFQMWQMLRQCPTTVLFTDEQWQQHSGRWSQQLGSLIIEGGQDRISVVNRHGLLHVRIAAVLTVLRKWNEYKRIAAATHPVSDSQLERMTELFGREHAQMTCRDDDFQTAMDIAETLLSHTLHLSTTIVQHQNRNVQPMQEWPWAVRCTAGLADVFRSQDFADLAEKKYGRGRSQSFRSLRALVDDGYLGRRDRGEYFKTNKLIKICATPKKCD